MPETSLKQENAKPIHAFVAVSGVLMVWFSVGMPVNAAGVIEACSSLPEWLTAVSVLSFTVVVEALGSAVGPDTKAKIVFMRTRDPLPGCRAFDSISMSRDHRIDRAKLKRLLGGNFPRKPSEQNARWYQMYRLVSDDVAVGDSHRDYLLFRDLCWFAAMFSAAALTCVAVNRTHQAPNSAIAAAFICLTIVFCLAARQRGVRFVNNVLVAYASRAD